MGLLLCMFKIPKRIEYSSQRLKMVQIKGNHILPSAVQYLGEPWTDCTWYQRIGSQVGNWKCSLLPGLTESKDGTEKQGWPRPSREENLAQLQSYWWCKYSFLNSGQISLTAQQRRKGNSRERNLGRAVQCYLLLTSEHVRFPKLGNVTSERSHWVLMSQANIPVRTSTEKAAGIPCSDHPQGNPTGLIFHITGGFTWLSVFLWEEPPWWTKSVTSAANPFIIIGTPGAYLAALSYDRDSSYSRCSPKSPGPNWLWLLTMAQMTFHSLTLGDSSLAKAIEIWNRNREVASGCSEASWEESNGMDPCGHILFHLNDAKVLRISLCFSQEELEAQRIIRTLWANQLVKKLTCF